MLPPLGPDEGFYERMADIRRGDSNLNVNLRGQSFDFPLRAQFQLDRRQGAA